MTTKRIIEIDADKVGAYMRVDGQVQTELPDYLEVRIDVRNLRLRGRNDERAERPLSYPYSIVIDCDDDGVFADINGTEIKGPDLAGVFDTLHEMFFPIGAPRPQVDTVAKPCDHPQTMAVAGCKGCPFFRLHGDADPDNFYECTAASRNMSADPRGKAPPVWCPLTNDVVLVRYQAKKE